MTVFKSKLAKTIGIGLLTAGVAVAASKSLSRLYDKVVIDHVAEGVVEYVNNLTKLPRLEDLGMKTNSYELRER